MSCFNCCCNSCSTTTNTIQFSGYINNQCNGVANVISSPIMTGKNIQFHLENIGVCPISIFITYIDTNNATQMLSYTIGPNAYYTSSTINNFVSTSVACALTTIPNSTNTCNSCNTCAPSNSCTPCNGCNGYNACSNCNPCNSCNSCNSCNVCNHCYGCNNSVYCSSPNTCDCCGRYTFTLL